MLLGNLLLIITFGARRSSKVVMRNFKFHNPSTTYNEFKMSLKFGTSNPRRPTLTFEGNEYVRKQETNTTTHRICRNYRTIKCSTIVITSGNAITNNPEHHICNFKPGAAEARELKNGMKEKTGFLGKPGELVGPNSYKSAKRGIELT